MIMKVRWKKHEVLTITIIVVVSIAGHLWDFYKLTDTQIVSMYANSYTLNKLSFNYYHNILFPQLGSIMLLYLSYLWINLFSLSKFLSFKNKSAIKWAMIIIQLITISFLLALGINAISYYAHPHFFNYGGFRLLTFFGYNEQALNNIFDGFTEALAFVAIYAVYAFARDHISSKIENSNYKSAYRALVTNQLTTLLAIFICIPLIPITFDLFNNDFIYTIYYACIPPFILVYISNIYWLFPKIQKTYVSADFVVRLLLSTSIFSFPFILLFMPRAPILGFWGINWGIQLVLFTPLSWLLYEQKKDKIIRLRGAEKALTKSKAHLQFLRSQINPHFLFNVLNTLYGTALLEDSKRTAEGIQMLGDMMRYMLYDNNQDFIPMSSEIAYLQNYISLQKLRLPGTAEINIEETIDACSCQHNIMPMLLIPFVENAFKHGINLSEPSWIRVDLKCDEQSLRFEVRNSLHHQTENNVEKEQSGIGLENVRERLHYFYEDKHQLEYGAKGQEFVVVLVIVKSPN